MRVTVCEMHDSADEFERDWNALVRHVRDHRSALVVLPEMPFAPWFAVTPSFDASIWAAVVARHDAWLARLPELAPAAVIASRPTERGGRRVNEGFAWDDRNGYRAAHVKRFLPREEGFFETDWYFPGDGSFNTFRAAQLSLGMLLCTELWSLGHAQQYGKAGAHVIVTPRATGRDTVEKWRTGGRVAAIVAGAYSLSSNRTAPPDGPDLGGGGWIVAPDGEVLAVTSQTAPFATADIEPARAERAKQTYPRYALE